MIQTINATCPFCNTSNKIEKGGSKYSLGECEKCGKVSLMEENKNEGEQE